MRHYVIYLPLFFIFFNIGSIFAQYHAIHEIDSARDMSPYFLPTAFSHTKFIEYEPLTFYPVDTGMVAAHLYEPLLKTENIYQNLGINGQAHQSMVFDYQREMGFVYLYIPYPLYFKKQSDLLFYKLKTTYTKVAYAFGFPKENNLFTTFARNIRGVTVAANVYASFIPDGTFAHQATRNICGDFLVHYEIPSSIYGFRASYIINHVNNFENGGLSELDMQLYRDSAKQKDSDYGIRFDDARSAITTHDLAIQNYVNIKDKRERYFGTFSYDFQLGQTTICYNDKWAMTEDSIHPYYLTYFSNIATNDTTRILTAKNAFQWSNFAPFQEMSSKNYFFHIAGGLMYDYSTIRYTSMQFHTCYLFARTHIRLFKLMDVHAQISYAFNGYTKNDASAKVLATWAIDRTKDHAIGLNANFHRNAPEYLLQHVETNHFQWDTAFLKQNIVQLKAFWNYNNYHAAISYYYLNKWIYLAEDLRPAQNKNNGNVIQIAAFIPFRIKNFGTTANLNLQFCTKEVVHLPLFTGKLSVFYIVELLKKRLKIQVGSDFMYNTTYYADAYLHVLHKFYYQQTQQVGNFVYMDVNLTVKIDRINFFLRMGNLLAPVMGYRNITTPYYPVNNYMKNLGNINLGISWRFYD